MLTKKLKRFKILFFLKRNEIRGFLFLTEMVQPYFEAAHRWGRGGEKVPPFPKICHKYPTVKKLGTDIHYLKRIQKIFESCDTLLRVC